MLSTEQGMDQGIHLPSQFSRRNTHARAVLAIAFISHPEIDIAVSNALRTACGGDERHSGWCHENGLLSLPRWLAIAFSAMCVAAAACAAIRTVHRHKRLFGAHQARCLFLLATFAAGPGLVANVALKDNWGRARPREVIQFGGEHHFTPALIPARECVDNCSFVSGEAAAVYAPFFAAALLLPQARVALLVAGLVAGTMTGLVRMSTGGHFLSDILFAGFFMALTASFLHAAMVSAWTRHRTQTDVSLDRASWLPWQLSPQPGTRNALEAQ